MQTSIHPSAVVDRNATVDENVVIGPFCCVGPNVVLESGVNLISHVVISGRTTLGSNTHVFPFTTLGLPPQDRKYQGEESWLIIGRNNTIREHVTINPGTRKGGMVTRIGDNCLLLVGTHVAHDCQLGNNVILANCATLAGHVSVGDFTNIGGLAAIHQFVRIGAHAMIGGLSGIGYDVIPYGLVVGHRATLKGLNITGLKRRGFTQEDIRILRSVYHLLFMATFEETLNERVHRLTEQYANHPLVIEILSFMSDPSYRGLCLPRE